VSALSTEVAPPPGAAPHAPITAARVLPWALLAAAVAFNLIELRAEPTAVPYLNDSPVHEQMVRFAAGQLQRGDLPLQSWFPYLGLGSPQFLHYQSLPAMLTGLLGTVISPDSAFRLTLYLLLSAWPVSVYVSARLFGASGMAAGCSALIAPFLVSAPGVGYEQRAYVWIGFGVWAQLWASLTLPLAWGLSWRAIVDGRRYLPAVAMIALTSALHFETGYLAFVPLLLWPLAAGRPFQVRLRRAAVVLAGALVCSAWVIVPLLAQRSWAALNEPLHATALVNGYGAPTVLRWLFTGQLLDEGRVPVITLLAAVGLVLACARWRRDPAGRALALALVACLVLSFGRTTFGTLADVIPGSADVFFRRFQMGAELAALLLAGRGLEHCARTAKAGLDRAARALSGRARRAWPYAAAGILGAAAILVLAPAWTQASSYDAGNARAVAAQRLADARDGAQLDSLLRIVARSGGGRVYAGMPSNWGMAFTVGAVPVFKYLESRDIDEVGYTLRTASLMTDPEYYFDERDESDYVLFGVRYLLAPAGRPTPVPARALACVGVYCLWEVAGGGYIHLGTLDWGFVADRSNVGVRSVALLHSNLAADGAYLRVRWGHGGSIPLPALTERTPPAPGAVIEQRSELQDGTARATVAMRRAGIAVLSASFDPGWTVTVDHRAASVLMVAPALPAVALTPGVHTVVFHYAGYPHYPLLFALCGLSLAALAGFDLARRRS